MNSPSRSLQGYGRVAAVAATLLVMAPLQAHHSFAPYDMNKSVADDGRGHARQPRRQPPADLLRRR